MYRVADVDLGEMAEHDLHEGVLEPDPGAEHRRRLVSAVRDAFTLRHGLPCLGAVEGQ